MAEVGACLVEVDERLNFSKDLNLDTRQVFGLGLGTTVGKGGG